MAIDPMTMGVMAGTQLLGGVMGNSSARRAAQVQADAARYVADQQLRAGREANVLLGDVYRQNVEMQTPQMLAGQRALSALQAGMGLGPLQTRATRPVSGDVGVQGATGYLDATGNPYSGPVTMNAAGQPIDASGRPLTARVDLGDAPLLTDEEAAAAASPYEGTFTEQFTGQDIYRDPSYEFRLNEGLRALRQRQAASGNRLGGQALRDINDYAQGAASTEFGNAYQRFMQQKEALYNRLAGIVQGGQQTTSNVTTQGTQIGGQMGGNITGQTNAAGGTQLGGATATAGGIVGGTNALTTGMSNAVAPWFASQFANGITQGFSRPPYRASWDNPGQ